MVKAWSISLSGNPGSQASEVGPEAGDWEMALGHCPLDPQPEVDTRPFYPLGTVGPVCTACRNSQVIEIFEN